MSHNKTKDAPSKATAGRLWRSLSPIRRLMMFGTTSPTNGILPTVTITSDVIKATIISTVAHQNLHNHPRHRHRRARQHNRKRARQAADQHQFGAVRQGKHIRPAEIGNAHRQADGKQRRQQQEVGQVEGKRFGSHKQKGKALRRRRFKQGSPNRRSGKPCLKPPYRAEDRASSNKNACRHSRDIVD